MTEHRSGAFDGVTSKLPTGGYAGAPRQMLQLSMQYLEKTNSDTVHRITPAEPPGRVTDTSKDPTLRQVAVDGGVLQSEFKEDERTSLASGGNQLEKKQGAGIVGTGTKAANTSIAPKAKFKEEAKEDAEKLFPDLEKGTYSEGIGLQSAQKEGEYRSSSTGCNQLEKEQGAVILGTAAKAMKTSIPPKAKAEEDTAAAEAVKKSIDPKAEAKKDTAAAEAGKTSIDPKAKAKEDSKAKAKEDTDKLFSELEEHESTTIIDEENAETIKARTMHNMVEDLQTEACRRKLMFLSGAQADLIASDAAGIEKMLTIGFEVPAPQLVINLLLSMGLDNDMHQKCQELSSRSAVAKIDQFMADILIPLAARTHAIILCSAETNCCLSLSLTRVLALVRAKYGPHPPFTVISTLGEIRWLYLCGPEKGSTWRQIRAASKVWRNRENAGMGKLLRDWLQSGKCSKSYETDIDPNAVNLIIVDPSNDKVLCPPNHQMPYNKLITETCRHLMSTLPSLTLKTGYAGADSGFSGLQMALQSSHLGSPVLFLDCLERPLPPAGVVEAGRAELIKWASQNFSDTIHGYYSAMTLAWLHDIFNGDGTPETNESVAKHAGDGNPEKMDLHTAIEIKQKEGSIMAGKNHLLERATKEERQDLLNEFCWQFLSAEHSVRKVLGLKKEGDFIREKEEKKSRNQEKVHSLAQRATMLLESTSLYTANLHHAPTKEVNRLVQQLLRLDRLPAENSLEGLRLLKQAWDEHDIAQHLAEQYKILAKVLFALQLLLAFVTVSFSSLVYEQILEAELIHELIFIIAVVASILTSFDAFVNAKSKWRQLRTSAGTLNSIIWQYRCRVAQFDADGVRSTLATPEATLRETLVQWRLELAAGADLGNSALRREYPPSVFKHGQQSPQEKRYCLCRRRMSEAITLTNDDHYAPVDAENYVSMRLRPMVAWYRERIPKRWKNRMILKLLMLAASMASALLARRSLSQWVAIVTALGTAITSWSEFSDGGSKIERYNRVINSIENLLTWWSSISPVNKASKSNIGHLVMMGESTLSSERLAWQSTLSNDKKQDERDEEDIEEGKSKEV